MADAEDIVQETFIRWHQTSEQKIEAPRVLLVTILTRLAINHLQSARVKREEYFGNWLPEPLVTAPGQNPSAALEVDESLSLAFLLLLERLTPTERATFLLREVFDLEYSEIASVLDQSESNCRQILRGRGNTSKNPAPALKHRASSIMTCYANLTKHPPKAISKDLLPCFQERQSSTPMEGAKGRHCPDRFTGLRTLLEAYWKV
jgi:RNA polymerase sigma factor (sigma-70 family)